MILSGILYPKRIVGSFILYSNSRVTCIKLYAKFSLRVGLGIDDLLMLCSFLKKQLNYSFNELVELTRCVSERELLEKEWQSDQGLFHI